MKRLWMIALVVVALIVGFALTANVSRNYLIVAKGQGAGSADLDDAVTASGGQITAKIPEIGVVLATSDNPNFLAQIVGDARVQQAAEDIEVPWINNEPNVEAADLILHPDGVNSEPYNAYLWNIRQIHADDTAAAGDQGWGVKRARVAVLDAGIWSAHPDIAPNLNVALSKSFVPTEVPSVRTQSR